MIFVVQLANGKGPHSGEFFYVQSTSAEDATAAMKAVVPGAVVDKVMITDKMSNADREAVLEGSGWVKPVGIAPGTAA